MKQRINMKVLALCVGLLFAAAMAPMGKARAASDGNNPAEIVVATFIPQLFNAGRCGELNVYVTSAKLSRLYSPPYTGSIRWTRWRIRAATSYLYQTMDYTGSAAKQVRTSNGWTVVWEQITTASCNVRRTQYA